MSNIKKFEDIFINLDFIESIMCDKHGCDKDGKDNYTIRLNASKFYKNFKETPYFKGKTIYNTREEANQVINKLIKDNKKGIVEIDGIFVNPFNAEAIYTRGYEGHYTLYFAFKEHGISGTTEYKTKEEAKQRIREIIKTQNKEQEQWEH